MKNKKEFFENIIYPVRLHLELKEERLTDYQKRMLRRYGESFSGDRITRDILAPSDMPLHNLHYAIQRLFGWQNSHLRRFYLPDEIYSQLTAGMVRGWAQLVGLVFQPPSIGEEDLFWDDDYEKGSINTWLRRKYTGPYKYGGFLEDPDLARRDVELLIDRFPMIEVSESFQDYLKRKEKGADAEIRTVKKAPLIDLTIKEMERTISMPTFADNLLERLEVNKVLAAQDEDLSGGDLFPLTKELYYNYDYGDDWIIKITKFKDCQDLIDNNLVHEREIQEAIEVVMDQHKPVCINKEGLTLFDDIGGISGFANFLGIIYEGEDKEEASYFRSLARRYGWSAAKRYCQKIL